MIKEYILNKIYEIFKEFMYNDISAAEESANKFWQEVLEQQIPLDDIDEHLKRFCIEEYESFERAENEE